jgi:hypothetical protein
MGRAEILRARLGLTSRDSSRHAHQVSKSRPPFDVLGRVCTRRSYFDNGR